MSSHAQEVILFPDAKAKTKGRGNEGTTRRSFLGAAGATVLSLAVPLSAQALTTNRKSRSSGSLTVLPEDGRGIYLDAIDSATETIRIEICVLEDPHVLEHIQAALQRGVSVRAIVDFRKYNALAAERDHLERYLTSAGGELHLSNPLFPRSFPKIVLIDSGLMVYGSACLDQTTFLRYRDFATTCDDADILREVVALFENDWAYSAPVGQAPPRFNPTSPITNGDLIISPVNAAERVVGLYQQASQTLDVYTELLGNITLESELVAAVNRGVRVRLISPVQVAGGSKETVDRQLASLTALSGAGVNSHVSGFGSPGLPYMHARAAIVDSRVGCLGSNSLSPNSVTANRGMDLIFRDSSLVEQLQAQFESDYALLTRPF